MFPRFRRAIIPAIRLCSKQLALTSNHVTNLAKKQVVLINYTLPRLYSVQTNPEDMIVDYECVKKATSDSKILIVDVREPDEVKEHGKIPNSLNIPLGGVSSVLSTMSDKEFENTYKRAKPSEDTKIIFYCMIGKRSGMAQQNALNLGFKNAKNYLGSWTDWTNKSQS